MFERLQFRSSADQQVCLQNESDFLTEYLQTNDQSPETTRVEYLQQVARVRMDLDMAAGLLIEKNTATGVVMRYCPVFLLILMLCQQISGVIQKHVLRGKL